MRMRLLFNYISELSNQVEGSCIIKSVQQKSNVKGADYLDMILFDADGEVNAKLWDYSPDVFGSYAPQDVIKVRGTVSMYRDQEQLKIDKIRKATAADAVDMMLLVPSAPVASEDMFQSVKLYSERMTNPELKRVTSFLLDRYSHSLSFFPAALKLHHAVRGGLLFHMLTMLETAKGICTTYRKLYPELNCDLVYAGIILHDIAKINELDVNDLGIATGYTAEGELLGHITMGCNMLAETAREIDLDSEITMLLQHILLSHHEKPEFGSPKPPMFPEAEIVSTVDSLDAKLYEMYDVLDAMDKKTMSDRVWSLESRKLYNHRLSDSDE